MRNNIEKATNAAAQEKKEECKKNVSVGSSSSIRLALMLENTYPIECGECATSLQIGPSDEINFKE